MDQHNSLREAIESGDAVLGACGDTFSPSVVELYGELGVDFVWLDFEHGGPSPHDSLLLQDLTRAADVGGTELFVRIPGPDPALIRKSLDAGVRNLLVPRVDSADEVRDAVEATRFVYEDEPGERGKSGSRASAWGHAENYIESEDENVCLGVMIEKTTAVDELEEILSVPELGFVFIGPSDLSVQMGHPNEKTHPDVQNQITEIRDACLDADVPVGCIANDPEDATQAIEDGYQIVRIGGEFGALKSTIGDRLSRIER
ncbi:MAG: HpcH/HpaI aldolase/citrate lyase family protein [Halarchaeum sp.]